MGILIEETLREELWKNGGVHIYKKGDKQKMENCR
jgi:hypothetical protein